MGDFIQGYVNQITLLKQIHELKQEPALKQQMESEDSEMQQDLLKHFNDLEVSCCFWNSYRKMHNIVLSLSYSS